MQREYYVICCDLEEEPEHVDVGPKWVKCWLREVRLTHRMPNRKYKVRRWVLAERLCIFWLNVHRIRMWILLEFGYDPDFRNVDQSPFHKNEAGSKSYGTVVMRGAPTVPLIEGHAAT